MPDHYGVNVNCLKGFDVDAVEVRQAEGKSMSVSAEGARDVWAGPRT